MAPLSYSCTNCDYCSDHRRSHCLYCGCLCLGDYDELDCSFEDEALENLDLDESEETQ
jgi:hypothetical protein